MANHNCEKQGAGITHKELLRELDRLVGAVDKMEKTQYSNTEFRIKVEGVLAIVKYMGVANLVAWGALFVKNFI